MEQTIIKFFLFYFIIFLFIVNSYSENFDLKH